MSDITLINDSEQSSLVTNGLAKNGELYLKKAGSTDAGSIVVYDSGVWKTFANEYSAGFPNTYSVDFDGTNDYMDLGSSFAPFNFGTGDFAISLWFKAQSLSSSAFSALVGTHNNNSSVWSCYVKSNGFFIYGGGALTGGGTISTNQWYHGLVTRNSGTVTVYVNNSSVASVTSTGQYINASNANSKIAEDNTGSNPNFNGFIDEVAVWTSGLSASDVTSIYNSGAPNDISSLSPVGWWRMGDNDSGTGTTVTDQGSGGNNGALTNSPVFSTDVPS